MLYLLYAVAAGIGAMFYFDSLGVYFLVTGTYFFIDGLVLKAVDIVAKRRS